MVLSIFGIYAFASLVSVVLIGIDKGKAEKGQSRISEATLHWVEFFGGWPGSFLAQRHFHHKTRKTRYQVGYWVATVLNTLVVACLVMWRLGLLERILKK